MTPLEGIDAHSIRNFCCTWCKNWGISAPEGLEHWARTAQGATTFIRESWGGDNPSPFKRAAAAAMSIVYCAPIEGHIPAALVESEGLDEQISRVPKILQAVIANAFACFVLENSKIGECSDRTRITRPVQMSRHFYRDLLWLLTRSEFIRADLCGPISLIYEALAYQANPDARDKLTWTGEQGA